ncbi:XamI family restriction endonuclease [Oricola sp.]|uniref:XamI family restriction endonuclease n=1 Tax=Oricola sp. TaxID=1979950 RepID=UPI0025CDC612|nr:XamI family restriction endonuclease [Oricola sp.]MCI5074408.1 XamI family restriction endonuclease [Oricola sp.]
MPTPEQIAENERNCAIARGIYFNSRDAEVSRSDWHAALKDARGTIADALRASDYLRNPSAALQRSGFHMAAFRNLLAPPCSQDQFRILCGSWPKASEKSGSPLKSETADEVEAVLKEWFDPAAAPWIAHDRNPTRPELRTALQRASAFIALQRFQTVQRSRISEQQESAVIGLLTSLGWTKLPSRMIDTRAAVDKKTFMHKTRFATATTTSQEVDIACGLGGTVVAAIECKVTNDETNSVKRINDVLKKAAAWHAHWGSFVETVAVLQGVIAPKDVHRLSDERVHVFWSHDLEHFSSWIEKRLAS